MIKLDEKRKKFGGHRTRFEDKAIAFLGFPVTRGDSGRIHYYKHIFQLKNHM